jgi:single-strand DNA-binding protein
MLNKFIAIGNLTGDPETKNVGEDKKVCKFCIAINNRVNDSVTFVDVETWNKSAENCDRFLSKGRKIVIEGRLQLNKWKTQNGENRSKLFCVADIVTFLDKAEEPQNKESLPAPKQAPPSSSSNEDDEFADIPF